MRSPAVNGLAEPAVGVVSRADGRRHVEEHPGVLAARVGRQAAGQHPHNAVAVYQGVVDLEVEREAPPFEALDDVDLPRRAGEVELIAVQPRDEDAEFALIARAGERGAADVVVEVEIVVGNPAVHGAVLQTWMGELAVPWRDDVLPACLVDELAQVIGRRILRRGERQEPCDVHLRTRRLAVDEHHILRTKPDTVGAQGVSCGYADSVRVWTVARVVTVRAQALAGSGRWQRITVQAEPPVEAARSRTRYRRRFGTCRSLPARVRRKA